MLALYVHKWLGGRHMAFPRSKLEKLKNYIGSK